jgi:hypothetical protein
MQFCFISNIYAKNDERMLRKLCELHETMKGNLEVPQIASLARMCNKIVIQIELPILSASLHAQWLTDLVLRTWAIVA